MPLIHDETGDSEDITVHPKGDGGGLVGSALAAGKGAAKELIEPFTYGIPNEDKKSPVVNWAESSDPNHPYAEPAGRAVGAIAPLFALPDIEVPALLGRAGAAVAGRAAPLAQKLYQGTNFVPRTAPSKVPGMAMSALDRLVNWGWKGAVGGASVDPKDRAGGAQTGAEFGIGSGAIRNALIQAYKHMPHRGLVGAGLSGISLPLLAYLAYRERGGIHPWLMYHAAESLPAIGAAATPLFPPGVAGAAGSAATQLMGGGGSQTPDDEETISPK